MFALPVYAAELTYPREISQWQEVIVPPIADKATHAVWFFAANNSSHEWRVRSDGEKIIAKLRPVNYSEQRERPRFTPKAERFVGAPLLARFAHVQDGWLVGFNEGEFGGALYWFSEDGKNNYKVSDHQVVDFVSLPSGLYAIEGLAHMMYSKGSVIRIAKSGSNAHWQATTITELPFAPYVVCVSHDNSMLITLSDSLVEVGENGATTLLFADAPWGSLYPNSCVLSRDEQTLYIGMREFVGEFDIPSKKLRLLAPSTEFLNKLPPEDEQRVREPFKHQQSPSPGG